MLKGRQVINESKTYELVRHVAEGGMGAVYEAIQYGAEGFEKRIALKNIATHISRDPEFVRMFIGEAKLVADLVHQHIVQVYQLGKTEDMYYIAREYVNGVNLAHFIDRHYELEKNVPIELAAYIVSRVCRGLEYAHRKCDPDGKHLGIVHRDISPKNIMMDYEGVVKITDFGIAKARKVMEQNEGEILMGKVEYMSPEQARYLETDGRSDIFSLGIVLYETLTMRQMFEDDDVYQTLENVKHKPIKDPREYRPEIPGELVEILMKALDRDVDKRYQDAGEMGYALEHYMYHDRFGPTITTFGSYVRELFGVDDQGRPKPATDSERKVEQRSDTLYQDLM